eukprot:scaffold8126_cov170-Amphora_coffeaeformis.AAC.2
MPHTLPYIDFSISVAAAGAEQPPRFPAVVLNMMVMAVVVKDNDLGCLVFKHGTGRGKSSVTIG